MPSRVPRRISLALATGVVALVAAGCGGGDEQGGGAAGEPITIGAVLPLTGEVALDGELESNGMKLAVSQINAAGGVDGRPLRLRLQDGACDPAASASAAQRLITREKVVALSGAFCSSGTAAIVPLAGRYKVPFVSATSTAADLTAKDQPFFSRFAPTEALMSRQAIPFLAPKLGIKRAAIVVFNDDYGLSYAEANRTNLEDAGVQVLGVDTFGANTQDYSPFITRVQRRRADTILVAADTGPTAAFFKQFSQLGVTKINKLSAQIAASQQFIDLATSKGAEGIYATTPYVAASDAEKNGAFARAYEQRYGKAPEAGAAGGYTAVYLLADAIERAGSTDPQEVQDAIRSAKLDTIHGQLTFDEQGQGFIDFFLVQIRNGKIAIVKKLSTRG